METVLEIEQAIKKLPQAQRRELVERLEAEASEDWDSQIERDIKSGRLDKLAQEAIAEHRAGASSNFPADEK